MTANEIMTNALEEILTIGKPQMCVDANAKVGEARAEYDFKMIARQALKEAKEAN